MQFLIISAPAACCRRFVSLFVGLPPNGATALPVDCVARFALQAFARLSRPSVVSYGAALSAFEEAGQWQQAVWLLTDALLDSK